MNLFGDCTYDNFIHIYTLPKCDKIVSIYYKENTFYPDFIFLSAKINFADIKLILKNNSLAIIFTDENFFNEKIFYQDQLFYALNICKIV